MITPHRMEEDLFEDSIDTFNWTFINGLAFCVCKQKQNL